MRNYYGNKNDYTLTNEAKQIMQTKEYQQL